MFNPSRSKQVDLLVIAGEASGDEHAGHLVGNLKNRYPNLKVAALGGKNLKESGLIFFLTWLITPLLEFLKCSKTMVFLKNFWVHLAMGGRVSS